MDAALAFSDREFAQAGQLSRQDLNFRDARRRGWLGFKVAYKALETRFSPFDVNFHPLFAVQHPPIQGIGLRQTVDKRAESHALYDTPNSNRTGTCHGYLSCFSWLPIPGCLISVPNPQPCNRDLAIRLERLYRPPPGLARCAVRRKARACVGALPDRLLRHI